MQYIPDTEVMIVTLVGRQQGLLVPKGNPKRILSLSDLVRPDVIFVNRQRGSGTRVLLDYHLDSLNLTKEMIRGYSHEEFTHLAVGAAIASGRSDCGLGIAAVTHALELEFIPLFDERYDLIIPKEFASSPLLAPLFKVLDDNNFRKIVAGLPGYDVEPMGRLIAELP
jgi:putative molybdopterin biosynthesis protein